MNATLQECYEIMQENCGIEVGDRVRVLRKAENHELGWGNSWVSKMNGVVGKSCIVEKIGPGCGMRLAGDGYGYNYPFFVLGIIESADSKQLKVSSLRAIQSPDSNGLRLAMMSNPRAIWDGKWEIGHISTNAKASDYLRPNEVKEFANGLLRMIGGKI